MRLEDLDEIRIIINPGAGNGHQKANITLMQRLRELGFKGIFDVRYIEAYPLENDRRPKFGIFWGMINAVYPENPVLQDIRDEAGAIGRVLHLLIPAFIPNDLTKPDPGQIIDDPDLGIGKMRITRLPRRFYANPKNVLPPTKLTMTAADDMGMPEIKKDEQICSYFSEKRRTPDVFNTETFASLQPTNWKGDKFVREASKIDAFENIDKDAILFSHTDLIVDPAKVSPVELKILDLIHHEAYRTQLVYTSQSDIKKTSPSVLYSLLEQAHAPISANNYKPLLILMPRLEGNSDVDLTRSTINAIPVGQKIIKIYIGSVSQAMFEYLLRETTYPPVLEGANSIAYCEERGVPYIHCLDNNAPLRWYKVEDVATQRLHECASECMQKQQPGKLPALQAYLQRAGEEDENILKYHEDRMNEFHKRPDGCEEALNKLHITIRPKA